MTISAAAQYLSIVLYGNRFFPKYANCVLAGLDKNGKAHLYSYDSVGSYSKDGESRAAAGAASSLIVPFLDNQVKRPLTTSPLDWTLIEIKIRSNSRTSLFRHREVLKRGRRNRLMRIP